MAKFMVVDFDDWVALYKDGEKIMENHSLRLQDVIEEMEDDVDCEYVFVDYETPLGDYIESNGRPPETVLEVQELIDES
jgi:hypothetical protein